MLWRPVEGRIPVAGRTCQVILAEADPVCLVAFDRTIAKLARTNGTILYFTAH
jgi:hypothetical protein